MRLHGLLLLAALGAVVLACCKSIDMAGTPPPTGTSAFRYHELYNAYQQTHWSFIKAAYRSGGTPAYDIAAGFAYSAARKLERMRELIKDEKQKAAITPIIARYVQAADRLKIRGSIGRENAVSRWGIEVRDICSLDKVKFPDDPAPKPAPTPPPASTDETPAWVYFAAWEKLHEELVKKWRAGEDCTDPYDKLIETLEKLLGRLPVDRRAKLQTCIESYHATSEITMGLTEVPEGATRLAVESDLNSVAAAIRLHYK